MLTLILIVAAILLILSFVVAAIRRHDANSYFDQDRDPFYAESARLAAAGLLYERDDKGEGRGRKTYVVTPAGEAALRVWLREPHNDPGMLRLYFAGITAPEDVVALARSQQQEHRRQLAKLEKITALLDDDEWQGSRDLARLSARFERMCVEFWADQADTPLHEPLEQR